MHHYLQLGDRQFDRFFADGRGPLKRLFYALRPAMALPRKPEADPTLAREADGLLYETARRA